MEQKTDKLYPSAPLGKKISLEKILEKNNDVNSFDNSVNNIEETTTFFNDKAHKSKKNKNFKTVITILKSLDSSINFGATFTFKSLSIIGIKLNILPISAGVACTLSIGNKVLHKLIINKYKNLKNNMKKINKLFNPLIIYTESLQHKITLTVLIKLVQNEIVLKDLLLMVSVNQFYALSFLLLNWVIEFIIQIKFQKDK